MKSVIQYILWFCVFVSIHYLEALPPIAGLSVAQLWKLPLIVFTFILVIKRKKKFSFELVGLLTFFEAFLCPEMLVSPLTVMLYASKNLLLVLAYSYWAKYYSNKKEKLQTVIYSIAQFICLSAIPIHIGLMEPPYVAKIADSFGDDVEYFRGVFGSAHCAASYFCIAILILVNGFMQKRFGDIKSKCYNAFLIAIGFYSIFGAFVRTGWLMLAVGIFLLFDFTKMTIKKFVAYVAVFFVLGGGVLWLYNNNDAFYGRITGRNVYTGAGGEEIDTEGSGRTEFWKNAVNVWSRGNAYGILFGSGMTKVKKENERTIGISVFSHSQLFDQLAQYGLVGLTLLIVYYKELYNYLQQCRTSCYFRLGKSVFGATLVFIMFQNEPYFIYSVLFAALLVLIKQKSAHQVVNPKQYMPSCYKNSSI